MPPAPRVRYMYAARLFLLLSLLLVTAGCTIAKFQRQGRVATAEFDTTVPFDTARWLIVVPGSIAGQPRPFIFDTGADFTLLQRDKTAGRTFRASGASKREVDLGTDTLASLVVGDVEFLETFVTTTDLVGLKENFTNFGGILGQPIISKANWLIDYPARTLRVSNTEMGDSTFRRLKFQRRGGAPYTYVRIEGREYRAIIDLGSSSELNVPNDSKLARRLLARYPFTDRTRERYTLGGIQTITEKIGVVPQLSLSGIEFTDVAVTINTSSQLRIGSPLFKDCQVYIDNTNGTYRIAR